MAKRDETLLHMTEQMNRYLKSQQFLSKRVTISLKNFLSLLCLCCGRKEGTYLITLYLLIKFMYIGTAVFVLVALNYFMGSNFHMYGLQVLMELSAGKDWTDSHRFPRVTMCDFNIRRLGNVQRYTVQCVLPINLFNEKLFLFVWWWIILVILTQCVSIIKWGLRSISKVDDVRYIRKHLKLGGLVRTSSERSEEINKFVKQYLKSDGIFILRLVGSNTNTITVTDLVRSIWRSFVERDLRNNEKHPDNKIY